VRRLTVAADQTQSLVLSYRIASQPLIIAAGSDPDQSDSYARRLPDRNVLDIMMGFSQVLQRPVLQRVILGTVEPVIWRSGLKLTYSGNGNTPADAAGGWMGCVSTNHTGTVTFLDYAQDAEGNLERLALDFDDTCETTTVTQGSIRYHSAIPIRPRQVSNSGSEHFLKTLILNVL